MKSDVICSSSHLPNIFCLSLICLVGRFVGPITLRRTLLQFLATVMKYGEYASALAGTAIAIHSVYGLSVAVARPYTGTGPSWDDLDRLAVFHSVVQVLLLVVGLAANQDNGGAVTVAVILLSAAAMAGSAVVSIKNARGRANLVQVAGSAGPRAADDAAAAGQASPDCEDAPPAFCDSDSD